MQARFGGEAGLGGMGRMGLMGLMGWGRHLPGGNFVLAPVPLFA